MARRTLATLAGTALVALILAAPSGAAVTIGGDVSTPATSTPSCNNPCTWFQRVHPVRTITAPGAGVVVRWRIHPGSGSAAQNVRLRILRAAGGTAYEGGGASAAQPISTTGGLQVFPTRLPIRAGDHIGLDIAGGGAGASIQRPLADADLRYFNPRLPDSGTASPNVVPPLEVELVLNADIEADADGDKFGDETQDQCPTNAATQGPCAPVTPQCGDGVDNDGDGAIDKADPGCLSGGDSFNPADLNEGDESVRDLVLCGRRAISLVRADAKGRKVVLKGLVSTKLAGRSVGIFANYGTGKAALRQLATARPNAKGEFTARVKRPPKRLFNRARFQARVGSARSAQLKLPQSLASSSVRLRGGFIEVRGKINRPLLGKRNKVVIKRLVCGRLQTVGSAKPARSGAYRVRFAAPALGAAALYRAEAKVLARPKSKRYVKQFARAIGLALTDQTG